MNRKTHALTAVLVACLGAACAEEVVEESVYELLPVPVRDITVTASAAGSVEPIQTVEIKPITEDATIELRSVAVKIIPALVELEIERQWAGLRPGTEQGIPYICQHPDIAGLYINAGHYRNGVVLGAASARLMAEILLGQKTSLESAPYALYAAH